MRLALDHFPSREIAERVWDTYYIPGGKAPLDPYKQVQIHSIKPCRKLIQLTILANFVEIFLARYGHTNPVGINYLEKLQLPHLASIYGAMLGGVGYILMGAGIPLRIPGVLDAYVHHQPASYELGVSGALPDEHFSYSFDPREYLDVELGPLERPKFLPIIASNVLAQTMVKRANGHIDGFIVEGPTAGGHNAPPRGQMQFDSDGEVIYGERDHVDLGKLKAMGLPFWLAGGYGSPEKLREALDAGAAGVQVGTAFAFCRESALRPEFKKTLIARAQHSEACVRTDTLASPTGFPFKVAQLDGSLSQPEVYAARKRTCDLGFLREAYRAPDGSVQFRCPAEPEANYLAKGGDPKMMAGRKCLCNGLVSNIGQPQMREGGYAEPPIVTTGNDLTGIGRFVPQDGWEYSAADVIAKLLAGAQVQSTCDSQTSPEEKVTVPSGA